MAVLFIVLISVCIVGSLTLLPKMVKKLNYEVETFEELKCTDLGYVKRGKK